MAKKCGVLGIFVEQGLFIDKVGICRARRARPQIQIQFGCLFEWEPPAAAPLYTQICVLALLLNLIASEWLLSLGSDAKAVTTFSRIQVIKNSRLQGTWRMDRQSIEGKICNEPERT